MTDGGDVIRLSDVQQTVPDMAVGADDNVIPIDPNAPQPRWQRLNLADDQYAIPPEPPAVAGLLYHAKRHVISGPPESAKTLIAYRLLLEALRDGHPVAIVDLEMGATAARRLLHDLGATQDELAALYYTEPTEPPTPTDLQAIIDHGTRFVMLDAAAGAYHASGLDDNARKDVEQFAAVWIRPLWQAGIATIVVDHVTKDKETRGKFTIGSERKLGQADVHLSCEALKTLSRGGTGIVKIHVHKDRPAYLPRPVAALVDLASHPDTHAVTWTLRQATQTEAETGVFRPTALMQAVSRWLEKHPGQHSLNEIESHVKGKDVYKRDALELLVDEGYAIERKGPRGARLFESIKPYRRDDVEEMSGDEVGTRSAEEMADLQGKQPSEGPGRSNTEQTTLDGSTSSRENPASMRDSTSSRLRPDFVPDEVMTTSSLVPPPKGDEDDVGKGTGRGSSEDEQPPTIDDLLEKYDDQLDDDGIPW